MKTRKWGNIPLHPPTSIPHIPGIIKLWKYITRIFKKACVSSKIFLSKVRVRQKKRAMGKTARKKVLLQSGNLFPAGIL